MANVSFCFIAES